MEFLEGETERRYAWDTAAKFARQQAEAILRAAGNARLVMETAVRVVRDYRTTREGIEASQPAHVMGRFAGVWDLPYMPNTAYAAHMAAKGHPAYSAEAARLAFTVNSAHQLAMLRKAGY